MNDSVRYFLTDARAYAAVGAGLIAILLSSRRILGSWPIRGRVKPEDAKLCFAVLMLLLGIFFSPMAFDWSGEFAVAILFAFGLALAVELIRSRGWRYRVAGILLALLYCDAIYGVVRTWIARADSGHPFR